MSDFSIGFGATSPLLVVTCKDASGTPVDVSGLVSATLRMRKLGSNSPTGSLDVSAAMTKNTDGVDGKLKYTLTNAQSSRPGHYAATVTVDMGGGVVAVYPSSGFLDVQITPDVSTAQ